MFSKNATFIVAMQVYMYISDKLLHIYTELDSYYLNLSMCYLFSSCIQGVLKLLHIIAAFPTTSQVYKGHPPA